MEKEDLKQLREVFQDEFKKGFQESFGLVWEDNLEPELSRMHEKTFELVDKVGNIERKINTLPDKAYLDSKLADLEGNLVIKLRKEDEKVNRLIEILEQRKVIVKSEVDMLKQFEVFPSPPKTE